MMKIRIPSSRTCTAAALAFGVLSSSQAMAKDLTDILLEKGVITQQDVDKARAEEKQKTAAEESRRDSIAAKIPEWLSKITPFGDLRLREEGFYEDNYHARNRFRIRGRVGLTAKVADEISTTFRLATGNSNDPISRNQTLDSTFSQKPVSLDWAYMTLKPGKTFHIEPGWITVTAGKIPTSGVYRTSELVWDDDLAPEGATETLNLVEQRSGFLRSFNINAYQWVVDELAADGDPWIGGAQLVATMAPSNTTSWTLALADYNYINMNKVAAKYLNQYNDPPTNTVPNSSYNSQLANSNSVVRDANGLITGYKHKYNVIDIASELNASNPLNLGIPAGIFSDVAVNTETSDNNVGFYLGAGIGKAGKDWYHNSLKNPGDWGMSYTFARVEKDAVVSLFSYSDIDYSSPNATQKGSTNVQAHILRFDYELLQNLQLTFKTEFINALDREDSNANLQSNSTLFRTQLDAVVKF
jgi:hypothetical protein